MPILDDIMDHDLLGPAIRQGRQEGEIAILRRQTHKRFGTLPTWADERLAKLSIIELEALADRLFDASTIEDLLPR